MMDNATWYKAQYEAAMAHFRNEQKKNANLQRQLEEKTRLLAAYEAQPVYGCFLDDTFFEGLSQDKWTCDVVEVIIKPSTTAHLDALLAEAERKGMERAANMVYEAAADEPCIYSIVDAIRAAAQNLEGK